MPGGASSHSCGKGPTSLFPLNVPLIVIPYYLSQQTQGCVGCLYLEIHTSLFRFSLAESPWGLPLVADSPAARAEVVMAELAHLKLEKKPWPTGKIVPIC